MSVQEPLHEILKDKDIFFRCVEDSNEPIMITNKEGRIIYVNPAWTKSYEYSREEALGETPRLLRSVHQDADFYHRMWQRIKDPSIGYWKGELINRSKSGVEVPVLLSITPYKSPATGEISGYMAVALDLQEQKKLERQVQQQDRLATIGELTSGLAHEIGTPIGVIRGRSEMLLMEMQDHPQFQKPLDIIIKQIDRISSLISTLLRLSRKKDELILGSVLVKDCLHEVLELFDQKLKKARISVEVGLPDRLCIRADVERFEQVMINLLVNSIHAIEEKTRLNPDCEKRISVRGVQKGSRVELCFEDTGTGIPQDILDKVFLPFFTTKPTSKGTGLGLSIVSRLIEDMQGEIRVRSDQGQGTVFILGFEALS